MRPAQPARHGSSLIEVLAAITAGSVIFGLAVVAAYGLLRMEKNLRTERQTWASLGRLAEQFRDDAHAAQTVTMTSPAAREAQEPAPGGTEPQAAWTFHLAGDRQAEYAVTAGGVRRIERSAGKVASREDYWLPPGTTARLEVLGGSGRVALRIVPQQLEGRPVAAQPMRIEALVGFDHRFANKGRKP